MSCFSIICCEHLYILLKFTWFTKCLPLKLLTENALFTLSYNTKTMSSPHFNALCILGMSLYLCNLEIKLRVKLKIVQILTIARFESRKRTERKKKNFCSQTHTHIIRIVISNQKKKGKRKLKKMSGTVNYILSWLATNDSDCSKSICNTASPRVASHRIESQSCCILWLIELSQFAMTLLRRLPAMNAAACDWFFYSLISCSFKRYMRRYTIECKTK